MRLVVTGREGQVARALAERAGGDLQISRLGRPELDLAHWRDLIDLFTRHAPDVIVNAAAYTAVDQAENAREAAYAVNAAGAGAVADVAKRIGVPIVQISTDYVFDGTGDRPLVETDPTDPIGIYGASKLAGEAAVAAATPDHAILRTAWVYAPFGAISYGPCSASPPPATKFGWSVISMELRPRLSILPRRSRRWRAILPRGPETQVYAEYFT